MRLNLSIIPDDIDTAECGNRRQCVIAHALDRQLGLGGLGYIRVAANGAAYTTKGYRHWWTLPTTALNYLRKFDEIGEREGQQAAREAMEPAKFILKFIEKRPIAPPASRERKDAINTARQRRGKQVRKSPRYVGI